MALIDEIIEIDIDLASMSLSPLVHRTFACFLKMQGGVNSILINQSNLDEEIENIHADHQSEVRTWFKSGGSSLRVYSNNVEYLGKLKEIEEYNLIFAGNLAADQLKIHKSLKKELLLDKHLFFTVDKNFNIKDYPKGRGVHAMLSDEKVSTLEMFEYLAPYTKVDYYRKNNFETSKIEGLPLKTLSFLTSNNIGSLVYFSEFKENKYYNIVDVAGFGLNRNFLIKDLEYKIKNRSLTALSNGNKYNDMTLAKLDNVSASCCDFYVDLGIMESYTTSYVPKSKQQTEDVVNGIARGFKVSYKPLDEIKKMHINLQEEL